MRLIKIERGADAKTIKRDGDTAGGNAGNSARPTLLIPTALAYTPLTTLQLTSNCWFGFSKRVPTMSFNEITKLGTPDAPLRFGGQHCRDYMNHSPLSITRLLR